MIRLMAGLAVFLFLAFEILGADHGQRIHDGAAAVSAALVSPAREIAAKAPTRQVFIPAQPVVQLVVQQPVVPPVVPVGVTEAAATPADLVVAEALPQALPTGKLMHAPGGANVRTGPGRTYPVVGNLVAGDEVLVVDDTAAPGWVKVSLQGDGTSGWVAAKLLRE